MLLEDVPSVDFTALRRPSLLELDLVADLDQA
jgi:hypothetical protein